MFFISRLLRILNDRYLEKLKEKWWVKKLKCSKIEDQQDGISVANIGGVFIVIFVGIALACIILIFEYWWFKYYKHTSSRVTDINEAGKNNLNSVETAAQSSTSLAHDQRPNEPRHRTKTTSQIQVID